MKDGHATVKRYYDEMDEELARLETEYYPLQAQILPRGTAERARRDELWAKICNLRAGQHSRDNYRATH